MRVAVGVPTLSNFRGLAELFSSLWAEEYTPFVVNNWTYNNGVSKAWNEILRATQGYDLTVICNDDIVFHEGSFRNLISSWGSCPTDALIITGVNGRRNELWTKSPDYSCFSFGPKAYLDRVGLFDENFTPAYYEDNDSHYRVRLAGHEGYGYNDCVITHGGSKTQNADPRNPVVPPKKFEENKEYYKRKWGGVPGDENYLRPFDDPKMTLKDW